MIAKIIAAFIYTINRKHKFRLGGSRLLYGIKLLNSGLVCLARITSYSFDLKVRSQKADLAFAFHGHSAWYSWRVELNYSSNSDACSTNSSRVSGISSFRNVL